LLIAVLNNTVFSCPGRPGIVAWFIHRAALDDGLVRNLCDVASSMLRPPSYRERLVFFDRSGDQTILSLRAIYLSSDAQLSGSLCQANQKSLTDTLQRLNYLDPFAGLSVK
jgi:hypothetical protein